MAQWHPTHMTRVSDKAGGVMHTNEMIHELSVQSKQIEALREENERLEAERDAWREEAINNMEALHGGPPLSDGEMSAAEARVAARLQQKEKT